ncbi:DUF523 domain-containing protein [Candidatus Woesearchaeota archaeon]|nr:MAG: DUF523 domain-containing protein [Candidatus Woesearchaeota archaeon]
MKLVSACLLGINCKYNGGNNKNSKIIELSKQELLIPVCPEQLGGLPTPRPPAEQSSNRVIDVNGRDVTKEFINGAKETLKIAKLFGINEAILKQRSPSCGCGEIYDGSFSGRVIKGDGVTTALLKRHGIKVNSEEDF